MNLGISRQGANFAKSINAQSADIARGITELPFTVPQFMAGGGLPAPIERTSVEEDNVPAMLNKHEVVIPADVARFIGVEKINKMVINARKSMEKMEGSSPEEPDGGDEDDMTKYGMTPPPVIGGVAHAAGGADGEEVYKRMREEGRYLPTKDEIGPVVNYGLSQAKSTAADVKQAAGQALNSVKSSGPGYYDEAIKKGAGPGFAGLYATGRNIYDASAVPGKVLTTVPEPVKKFFSPGEVLSPGLNKPSAPETAQAAQPVKTAQPPAQTAPSGPGLNKPAATAAAETGPLNILGRPVQKLNDQGGYKVYGPNGETAVEIPWSSSDDSALRRTLTADEYKDRQLRVADYNDQRNAAVIAENGNFAPNYLPPGRGDGSLGLGLANLEFQQGKYLTEQSNKQRAKIDRVLGKYNQFVNGTIDKDNQPVSPAYKEPFFGQDPDQYVNLVGQALTSEGLDPSRGVNNLRRLLASGDYYPIEGGQFARTVKDKDGNEVQQPLDLGEFIASYYGE